MMMTKATPSAKVFLATLVSVALVFPFSVVYAEQFYVGNTVYNVCLNLPLFESPDRDARVLGLMKFGDSGNVASVHGKYELPDSDPASEAAQRTGHRQINKNLFRKISWARLSDKGYASSSCLVKKKIYDKQQPALAQAKVAKLNSDSGKRGCAEAEDGDLVAMQGAAGKAKRTVPNELGCAEAEEGDLVAMQGAAGKAKRKRVLPNEGSGKEYLSAYFATYEFSDNTEFRRQGGLGEFMN